MKALILCGGKGTRLRPITHTGAKQLVPVANRPILFYVIDNIISAGIKDIGIIVSPESNLEVKQAVTNNYKNINVTYILQRKPKGLAHAVKVAQNYLKKSPFLMFLGDNLVDIKLTRYVNKFKNNSSITGFLFLKRVKDPSSFGVVILDKLGNIKSLIEKPKNSPSNLALVGIYFFRSEIFEIIDKLKPSFRGEYEITDAISGLLEKGKKIEYEIINSWWLDTGKKDDILLANAVVLDHIVVPNKKGKIINSKIIGKVNIGKNSSVIDSVIKGPVIIGENTKIDKSFIGCHTSIGNSVEINNSKIVNSIILEECKIKNISKIENSLIGKRVEVRASTSKNSNILMVGDDSLIEI